MKLLTLALASTLAACGGSASDQNVYTPCSFDQGTQLTRTWIGTGQKMLFIGDSIIERYDVASYYPDKSTMNQGIGGQCTTQIGARFMRDAIAQAPDTIVLEGGINDIFRDQKSTSFIQDAALQAQTAGIHTVIVGVYAPGPAAAYRTADVLAWNAEMLAFSQSHGIDYIDNTLPGFQASLSADAIHLIAYGYDVLTNKIRGLI